MGMFDNLRKKAEKAVDQHGGKISQGLDKAAGMASKKTGGKHDAHIAKGTAAAKNALDKLDGRNDDIPDAAPRPTGSQHPTRPDDRPSTRPGPAPDDDHPAGPRPPR